MPKVILLQNNKCRQLSCVVVTKNASLLGQVLLCSPIEEDFCEDPDEVLVGFDAFGELSLPCRTMQHFA